MQSHMQQPILAWTTVGGNKHNGQEAVVALSMAVRSKWTYGKQVKWQVLQRVSVGQA